MEIQNSELLDKRVCLFFRADVLTQGLRENPKAWIGGTRYVKGLVKEINVAGVILELTQESTMGDFHFESGTLFFPWPVVAFLDITDEKI